MVPGGSPLHWLDRFRRDYPMALHGVSLSIGSIDPLDRRYLDELKALVERVQPLWVSDHLCFTGLRGQNMHDLLPLPYTEEALDHVAERVMRGAGPSRPPAGAGERVELRHLRRLRAHRMGVHRRARQARRLRDPARRQQRLRQRLQPRVRRARVPARHAARAGAPVPSRRPHPQGQPHHRHPRPSDRARRVGRSMPRR